MLLSQNKLTYLVDVGVRRGVLEFEIPQGGIYRMIDACAAAGLPEPALEESTGGFRMTFQKVVDVGGSVAEQVITRSDEQVSEQVGEQVTPHVAPQVTPHVAPHVAPQVTPHVAALLSVMTKDLDRDTLQQKLNLRARKNFRLLYLAPALDSGLIEMTLPDNPRSSNQKYRLTERGRAVLATVSKKVE